MPFKSSIWFTLFALTGLMLTGCAQQPVQAPQAYTREQLLTQQVEQSLIAAANSQSPEKTRHLLNAAQLYFELDRNNKALEILDQIASNTLSGELLAEHTLIYSQISLDSDDHLGARYRLTDPQLQAILDDLPGPLLIKLRRMRSDLFSLMGDDALAVAEYIELSHLQDNPRDIEESHNKLWQILNRTPEKILLARAVDTARQEIKGWYDLEIKGWYDLALATRRSRGDIAEQQRKLKLWNTRWQEHPAQITPPTNLTELKESTAVAPERVAVLLPLNGNYGTAGQVIRNGILAAYYNNIGSGNHAPSLHFYDTSEQEVSRLYQQAISEHADIVIGPLRKENLATLSKLDDLPIPVIGLNYLNKEAEADAFRHNNLYQLGLSVADEARQVAERAWLAGHRSALVITPANNWGAKARLAFSEHWNDKGGSIIASKPYPLDQSDFTDIIKPAFLIDQSDSRAKIIQRTLGKKLEYTARRRRDIDMIFMVAQPGHGRSIKPTLDFFYAHDLPVYATSHLYAGFENIDLNRDLNGVRFSAMPWTLPGMLTNPLLPDESILSAYRHLYALGIDAYQLHQGIALMNSALQTQFFGHTGTLTMTPGGIIKRNQPWAIFRNSKVRTVSTIREYR